MLKKIFLVCMFSYQLSCFGVEPPSAPPAATTTEQKKEEPPPPAEPPIHIDTQTTEEHHLTPVTSSENYEHAFIKMIATLVGLLALVFFTIWVLRKLSHGRLGSFGGQKAIQILEKKPLSPKSMLYLIEVSGKKVLIAESQLEVRTLSHLDSYMDEES